MKKQLQQLRRFFVRTKKLNLTATRNAMPTTYEEDDEGSSRLSGAFVVVLLLHVVAIVGVFAFSRIKDSRAANTNTASANSAVQNPKGGASKSAASAGGAASDQHQSDASKTSPALPPAGKTYVVKSGDNLTKIAVAYSTTPTELVSTNSLKSENDIRTGQVLTIPEGKSVKSAPAPESKPVVKAPAAAPAAAPSGPKTHIIQKGDTIAKIARENNCSYEELVKLNNIKDPKKLQPGQSVKIPAVKKG